MARHYRPKGFEEADELGTQRSALELGTQRLPRLEVDTPDRIASTADPIASTLQHNTKPHTHKSQKNPSVPGEPNHILNTLQTILHTKILVLFLPTCPNHPPDTQPTPTTDHSCFPRVLVPIPPNKTPPCYLFATPNFRTNTYFNM